MGEKNVPATWDSQHRNTEINSCRRRAAKRKYWTWEKVTLVCRQLGCSYYLGYSSTEKEGRSLFQNSLRVVEQVEQEKGNKRQGIETRRRTHVCPGYTFRHRPSILSSAFQRPSSLAYKSITPKARPTTDPPTTPALSETPALSVCSAGAALLVQLALPLGFESGT